MVAALSITGQELLHLNTQGYTYSDLARNYKLTRGQVAGRIRDYRARVEMRRVTPAANLYSRSSTELESLVSANSKLWADEMKRLSGMKRWLKLAFVTDIHAPYQDDAAYELALNIVSDFNPDVMVSGSDFFDFRSLGRWEDDRTVFQRVWDGDVGNAIAAHKKDSDNWKDAAPNAKRPFLPGNHDMRMVKYSLSKAPDTAAYTLVNFWRALCSHGALYLGDIPHLQLSPGLMLLHGTRTGKNAVVKTLEAFNFQRSVVFGHIHHIMSEERRGVDYDVSGYSVGCLCKLQPHWTSDHMNWQNGLLLGHYNPLGFEHALYNVKFVRSNGFLSAYLFDRHYRVKL